MPLYAKYCQSHYRDAFISRNLLKPLLINDYLVKSIV